MRVHKMTLIFMTIICVSSLIAALFLDNVNKPFWTNLAIGIFSSGFLALIISVVAYRVERRRTLEEFYSQAIKAIRNFNQYDKDDKPNVKMEIVVEMEKHDYNSLDTSFANIDFIWFNKKNQSRIYNEIYSKIMKYKSEIIHKQYHFNMYIKEQHTNLEVMLRFIDELEDIFLTKTNSEFISEDGSKTNITSVRRNADDILNDEISSWYFKLMYGNLGKSLK